MRKPSPPSSTGSRTRTNGSCGLRQVRQPGSPGSAGFPGLARMARLAEGRPIHARVPGSRGAAGLWPRRRRARSFATMSQQLQPLTAAVRELAPGRQHGPGRRASRSPATLCLSTRPTSPKLRERVRAIQALGGLIMSPSSCRDHGLRSVSDRIWPPGTRRKANVDVAHCSTTRAFSMR